MAPNSSFDHDEHDINQLSSDYAKRCRQLNKENGALDNTLSTTAAICNMVDYIGIKRGQPPSNKMQFDVAKKGV